MQILATILLVMAVCLALTPIVAKLSFLDMKAIPPPARAVAMFLIWVAIAFILTVLGWLLLFVAVIFAAVGKFMFLPFALLAG